MNLLTSLAGKLERALTMQSRSKIAAIATPQLRWRIVDGGESPPIHILEQAWRQEGGGDLQWRAVPFVVQERANG